MQLLESSVRGHIAQKFECMSKSSEPFQSVQMLPSVKLTEMNQCHRLRMTQSVDTGS